ncbi:hypothetical protein [Thiomicrorhabdus xiamenensis]|uniref:Glycosyltransferase n=1 Tax=Thiomicrorhabdus xiamenensis TaxID=2739063 RepID=A0A7D4SIH7_9GAMM|nr:hypothetical protein [Thiomicrorhabdus xiamenensis]QKI88639.1 hypothetical protein HQN79_03150 [Thiomicrorhabdus xiamenensis]
MLHVVCLKWGDKYSSEYVNRLYKMVRHNLKRTFKFHCITEDPQGIDSSILIEQLPKVDLKGWWYKLAIFKKDFLNLDESDRVLFLDLDIVITGPLDQLIDFDERFCITPGVLKNTYNSSIMCFDAGKYGFIWDSFLAQKELIMNEMHGDQDWIQHVYKNAVVYPKSLVKSFKLDLDSKIKFKFGKLGRSLRKRYTFFLPRGTVPYPVGTSVVLFHGKPDPHDVMEKPYDIYRRAPWVKDIYKEVESEFI